MFSINSLDTGIVIFDIQIALFPESDVKTLLIRYNASFINIYVELLW